MTGGAPMTWERWKIHLLPGIRTLGVDRGCGAESVPEGFRLYHHETGKGIIIGDDDLKQHCQNEDWGKTRTVILEAISGRKVP